MAIMIPSEPKNCTPESHEIEIYNALKLLPDDYYVFHSLSFLENKSNYLQDHEIDFVIFNKGKGMLIIEAKAGKIRYENGIWTYASGIKMSHNGPFEQAKLNMYSLKNELMRLDKSQRNIIDRCFMAYAVWFPSIDNKYAENLNCISCNSKIILTGDDLINPQPKIDSIFNPKENKTDLNKSDIEYLLNKILCPKFDIVSSESVILDNKRNTFNRLLAEQKSLLNFLDEQRFAVINGSAGTGKTFIAVEKARRLAANKEKVLFLCYNTFLKDYLKSKYSDPYIDFYTLDGYACHILGTKEANYPALSDKIEEHFDYIHVIVDEGQDFGQDGLDNNFFDILKICVEVKSDHGNFYVFYDSKQFVQGIKLLDFFNKAECKLILHKNCRNTRQIEQTSLSLLNASNKSTAAVEGNTTLFYRETTPSKAKSLVENIITKLQEKSIEDIVILTSDSESNSILNEYIINNYFVFNNKKYPFTSTRKFKGLEADAIILTDVNFNELTKNKNLFYVGSSRARLQLYIITNISDDDCKIIVDKFKDFGLFKKSIKGVANLVKSTYCDYK